MLAQGHKCGCCNKYKMPQRHYSCLIFSGYGLETTLSVKMKISLCIEYTNTQENKQESVRSPYDSHGYTPEIGYNAWEAYTT